MSLAPSGITTHQSPDNVSGSASLMPMVGFCARILFCNRGLICIEIGAARNANPLSVSSSGFCVTHDERFNGNWLDQLGVAGCGTVRNTTALGLHCFCHVA